ncbi:MAG TPA: hypothetical protein DCL38_05015 [Lachnospiraceae bacterium]|nr:hypothetical protein [Lachnospiraceae bacterium]
MRKRRHRERLILIGGLVVVGIIIVVVILLLLLNRKKLEYLTLTPTFQETELDVNSDYVFMVTTEPEGIKLKDLEYSVDDPTAVFSTASEDNTQAVLHTGAEGTVNIYVKQGDVVSNYMSFSVVDITAQAQLEAERQQQEQAELEAQQAIEAEQAAAAEEVKLYVQTTTKVRVRSSASTAADDNIITMVDKGSKFVKTGDASDEGGAAWTVIDYNGEEGYIRSDMVEEISEEEYNGAAPQAEGETSAEAAGEGDNKPEEEKKKEEKPAEAPAQASAEEQAAQAAQAAAAAAQKAQEDAAAAAAAAAAEQQAQLEAAAAAQAAVAAAAAAAGKTIQCTDGTMTVTPAQYKCLEGYWSYTGDTDGMISHHSKGEIQQLLSLNGL